MSDLKNTLNEIYASRIVREIQSSLTQFSSEALNNGADKAGLEAACKTYLETLEHKGAVHDHKITSSQIVKHTWTSLYPSRWKRALAYTFHRFVDVQALEQRWFHTILPFALKYTYEDADGEVCEGYVARLVLPHETLELGVSFRPVHTISSITLNFEASKSTGVIFHLDARADES